MNEEDLSPTTQLENGQITLGDDGFEPSEVTISLGTTITFVPTNEKLHTVQDRNGAINSGNLENGATYTHTFDSAGVFEIFCRYHIQNTAKIEVQ